MISNDTPLTSWVGHKPTRRAPSLSSVGLELSWSNKLHGCHRRDSFEWGRFEDSASDEPQLKPKRAARFRKLQSSIKTCGAKHQMRSNSSKSIDFDSDDNIFASIFEEPLVYQTHQGPVKIRKFENVLTAPRLTKSVASKHEMKSHFPDHITLDKTATTGFNSSVIYQAPKTPRFEYSPEFPTYDQSIRSKHKKTRCLPDPPTVNVNNDDNISSTVVDSPLKFERPNAPAFGRKSSDPLPETPMRVNRIDNVLPASMKKISKAPTQALKKLEPGPEPPLHSKNVEETPPHAPMKSLKRRSKIPIQALRKPGYESSIPLQVITGPKKMPQIPLTSNQTIGKRSALPKPVGTMRHTKTVIDLPQREDVFVDTVNLEAAVLDSDSLSERARKNLSQVLAAKEEEEKVSRAVRRAARRSHRESDDFLLGRGANPRTGVPDLSSGSSGEPHTVPPSNERRRKWQMSDNEWIVVEESPVSLPESDHKYQAHDEDVKEPILAKLSPEPTKQSPFLEQRLLIVPSLRRYLLSPPREIAAPSPMSGPYLLSFIDTTTSTTGLSPTHPALPNLSRNASRNLPQNLSRSLPRHIPQSLQQNPQQNVLPNFPQSPDDRGGTAEVLSRVGGLFVVAWAVVSLWGWA